jgi:hypothetical protein
LSDEEYPRRADLCCRADPSAKQVVCDQGFAAIYGQPRPSETAATETQNQMFKSAQRPKRGSDCCAEEKEENDSKVLDIEVMKCRGCGEELTRKKVSFYFIRIKKQKKEKYDFRTLKCSECGKGFNGKNNYVFFCMNNKCDYLAHPDKDCEVKGRSFFRKETKPVTNQKQPV